MNIAFIFPGQGSQSVGMLEALHAEHESVRETFGEASEALGFDLWALVSQGPDETLNQTDNTQPAMLASGYACWRAWQESNAPSASLMAGHSLGEYTALVCAGVIDFTDAIKLVALRGRLMQAAVPSGEGAMAAILGLEDEVVRQVCMESAEDQVVQAVNYNSPGQVVIAGNTAAVDRAMDKAKAAGAKRALKLPVSVPSHCDLMRPAAEQLADYMKDVTFSPATTGVLQNVSASMNMESDTIREALIDELYSPVQWVNIIREMANQDITHAIEMGPGKVLTGLNKRIDKNIDTLPVFDVESLQKAIQAVSE